MDEHESRKHRVARIAKVVAFPLFASCIGIGIALLLMYVGSERLYEDATTNRRLYKTEHFRLWIEDTSAVWMEKEARGDELERLYAELVAEYRPDEEEIPIPIDVFLHDSLDSFRHHLTVRKGATSQFIASAPLDLLAMEDPRGRLGELLLTFGWGQVVSRVFQVGMSLVMSYPDYNFHAVIAGLAEDQLLDLEQVLVMESRGRLSRTIYHAYDSPYTTAMLGSLTDLRSLMELEEGQIGMPDDLASLEAASLCQFIIESLGVDVMRACWGRGETRQLLQTRTGYPNLQALEQDWMTYASARGVDSQQYTTWRARSELAEGHPEAALDALESNEGVRDIDSELMYALASLAAGDLEAFAGVRNRLAEADVPDGAAGWLNAFSDPVTVRGEGVVAVGPSLHVSELEAAVREVEQTRARVSVVFGLQSLDETSVYSLFLYGEKERALFGAALEPVFKNIPAQAHHNVLDADFEAAMRQDAADALLARAYGEMSYSQLLRAGAANLAGASEAELMAHGAALVRGSRWTPLAILQMDSVSDDVGETESALLVRYIIEACGVEAFQDMWVSTAATTQFYSFDSALRSVCGVSRSEAEEAILGELLGDD